MEHLIAEFSRMPSFESHSCNQEMDGVLCVLLPSSLGLTAPQNIPVYIQHIWGVTHARDDQAPCSPDDGKPFF
jgi:hypothetical protein